MKNPILLSIKVFNETNTIEELITKMNTVNGVCDTDIANKIDEFKYKFDSFKTYLGNEYSEFTVDEIVKYFQYNGKLTDLKKWVDLYELLIALEFEWLKSDNNTIESTNYHQVLEQTYEEKFEMYMGLPKEDLVRMLIECNRILNLKSL